MWTNSLRLFAFGMVLLGLVVVGAAFTGCSSAATTTETSSAEELPVMMPADFGFVAAYGIYGRNELDSFTGTYTKDINSQTKPNPTVELRLTEEELAGLYQELRAMRILEYPEDLDKANTGITASTPTSYRLEFRAGGLERVVSLAHGEFTRTPEAKALVDWFRKLRGMIQTKPEYERLPSMERGYS